jgi:hypothetical protein
VEDDLRCKDDLKVCRMWLMSSRGILRGNLECGSAQPSLFFTEWCMNWWWIDDLHPVTWHIRTIWIYLFASVKYYLTPLKRGSLTQCKRNQFKPITCCWENAPNVPLNEHILLDLKMAISEHVLNIFSAPGHRFELISLHCIRLPKAQV